MLHSVHKRSTREPEIHLKAFGKDISLSLKPTEGLLRGNRLPMWTVTKNASQPDGLRYEKVTNVSFPHTSRKNLSLSRKKNIIFYSIFVKIPTSFGLRVFKSEKHESENQINAKLCRIALKSSSSIFQNIYFNIIFQRLSSSSTTI